MLGRLIQSYGKGPPNLESSTEEAHSRSLLWPTYAQDHARSLPSSPPSIPSTPISSPSFRLGPFDDRGGVELNEARDLRVVIAQDAFGSLDKQLVLFDSHKTGSETSSARRSQAPKSNPQNAYNPRNQHGAQAHARSRSSTITGPASAWARQNRESETDDKVNRLLECMFGNTSTTKSDASTKMHILVSGSDSVPTQLPASSFSASRPSMPRALTSQTTSRQIRTARTGADESNQDQDVILITRLFAVPLPDSKEPVNSRPKSGDQTVDVVSPVGEEGATRKTKLVEKKTPMYAVGLLISLPSEDARPSFSRPPSRGSMASSSFPNSVGSDFSSSWSLLEAISESLASARGGAKHLDKRITLLTNSWDVILRALSDVETVAKAEIRHLLQLVNREVMSSMVKVPKGLNEQRTNQRNIYITQQMALARTSALDKCSRHMVQRLSLALRIPRVTTGIGFRDGHWNDEARYLVHVCSSKSQSHFLLNLLTAFLGNHTEWLGSALTRRPARGLPDEEESHEPSLGLSRTVVICDQRALARRFIFLLASFLPSAAGISPFEHQATPFKSQLPTPSLTSSSPLKQMRSMGSKVGDTRRSSHSQHVSFGEASDYPHLSTSASSNTSASTHASMRRTRPLGDRKDTDSASIRTTSRFPVASSSTHMRKASAANSALAPQPASTQPYFAAKQDSYFPSDVIVDDGDFGASDRLAQILRRDSSSTVAPRSASGSWGFLGLWSRRTTPTGALEDSDEPGMQSRENSNRGMSKLESMVGEATVCTLPQSISQPRKSDVTADKGNDLFVEHDERPTFVANPRLKVDEEDGVVDVEIGIPGFLGWDDDDCPTSPGPHHRAYGRSLEGASSLRSSFSHPASQPNQVNTEQAGVAGFLRQYHEDFKLQAVKPYADLVTDVKESMVRESITLLNKDASSMTEAGAYAEEWIDVNSTIMVDVRRFTVEKIILRRRLNKSRIVDVSNPPALTDTRAAIEHRFITVPVVEADQMLAESISSILDVSRTPSHSRSASGGTNSGTVTPSESYSKGHRLPPPRLLRSSYQQAVAESLEQIVKSVSDDLGAHEQSRWMPQTDMTKTRSREAQEHNLLRDGIKRWLVAAESRSVW